MTTTYCPRCLKFIDKVLPHTCTPHPAAQEIERLQKDQNDRIIKEQFAASVIRDQDAMLERLRAENQRLRGYLKRYLEETPLGHQPHMIAHVVRAALEGK